MTVKEHILALLDSRKGEYLSGEDIAGQLSVTRSAVWKAIKSLQTEGYSIQAVTNKGYSLSAQTDILSAAAVSRYLDARGQKLSLEVFKSVVSTNEMVKTLASGGEAEGKVILAEEQTAGRGRKGRPFFSPSGTGIYMSILLRPKLSAADATLLTTSAAVAVALAIESVSGLSTQIKWVNDVFMNGKRYAVSSPRPPSRWRMSGWITQCSGSGSMWRCPPAGFPADCQRLQPQYTSRTSPRQICATGSLPRC